MAFWLEGSRRRTLDRDAGRIRRILFVDKESWLILATDSYDRAGQLWKVQAILYGFGKEAIPGAQGPKYEEPMVFHYAHVIYDTQLNHATTTSQPSSKYKGTECHILNMGPKSGTTDGSTGSGSLACVLTNTRSAVLVLARAYTTAYRSAAPG